MAKDWLGRDYMPKAIELLRQGKDDELWQMCCGFLSLNLDEFMEIQRRLLLEQIESLNSCPLGDKIMHGKKPRTIGEFRQIPLTTYKDYCPEFLEKREDILPVKPDSWVRTSGRSADYECKWVPMVPRYSQELSKVLYGIGMLSCCQDWGDTSRIPDNIKVLYSVAPRPYISGTFADLLRMQTPLDYLPSLEEAEELSFEERIKLGFQQSLSRGFDYFFGLSMILVTVGEKLRQSSEGIDIRQFISQPGALFRLAKGVVKSRLARRPMLPRDIWSLKGIIGSGIDSWVYKDKIEELWGRPPLDLYSCTEGGVIATQTWDYEGMTFIPDLNFLEFIPEEEHFKCQMDRSYQPKTLLLDEVEAGKNYEMVLSNFHGGAMVRYKIGDMVRITSLRNEKLGIDIPQMEFERRIDDMLDFVVVKLTEKTIWQAIEKAGIAYEDWTAYKIPGEPVLHLLIEPKNGFQDNKTEITAAIQEQIVDSGKSSYRESGIIEDWRDELDFSVEVTLLPPGAFAEYIARRQSEGADLAHIKPPHINPSDKVLSLLLAEEEETIVATRAKAGTKARASTEAEPEDEKIAV
jgi:hypothetical protein